MNQIQKTVNQKTMTSREIAELTGKELAHVHRDIRAMLDELKKDDPKLDHPQEDKDSRGYTSCFHLNRELTETLLTGYSASARLKVIRRWHELEEQARNPVAALSRVDLLKLALDSEEQRLALETQVAEQSAVLALQAPKVEAMDLLATRADGTMCITNAAKHLQAQPKRVFAWLQEHKWVYRRAGGSGFVGYQDKIQQGLLEHKITTVERSDGTSKMCEQVLVTAKGLAKMAGFFGGGAVVA